MDTLQHQTALITGGNSGIGYSTAKLFKEKGASVIITGRNEQSVKTSSATLGVKGYVSDQGNLADIDNLVEWIKQDFGKLDIVFLNAGIATFSPFENASESHFDEIMNINLKGVFFTLQKLLPLLNNHASTYSTPL